MTGAEHARSSMADVERRLDLLRSALERGDVDRSPVLDQATEDLGSSLEELRVALDELESTNEELAESKPVTNAEGRRYRELFQLTPAVCLVTDEKGLIRETNAATERPLGRPARDLLGKPLSAFVLASDRVRFFGFIESLPAGGGPCVEEREFRMRVQGERLFTGGAAAVRIANARAGEQGVRWLLRDLTEQLERERRSREAGDRRAYRHIAGGVIHHINNLLGSIRGFAEIIALDGETSERGIRSAGRIRAATERGERFANDLLQFARVGQRMAEKRSASVAIADVCELAGEMLPDGTTVRMHLSPDAGTVRIDPSGLYQAVLNLVFNARDALTEGGEIMVATRGVELDDATAAQLEACPGQYVALTVRDAGAGMDAQARSRATEFFFSTKSIDRGFGLGLSTAEAIVREAHGAIEIESEVRAGTTVTIYLPRV